MILKLIYCCLLGVVVGIIAEINCIVFPEYTKDIIWVSGIFLGEVVALVCLRDKK